MGSIARLEEWLTRHGASSPVFEPANIEAPTAVHRQADGQRKPIGLFDSHSLLSFKDAMAERAMMNGLRVQEQWPDSWWSPSWFPFASDFCGQLLVIDEPTGRVISFEHDGEERNVLADSFDAYVESITAGLESGTLVFDARLGIFRKADVERLAEDQKQRAQAVRTSTRAKVILGLIVAVIFALALWFRV